MNLKKYLTKKFIAILIISFLLFYASSILSYKNQLPVDGPITRGFPLTYYYMPSGFCIDCNNEPVFNFSYYLANYLIYYSVSYFLVNFLLSKFKNKPIKNNNNENKKQKLLEK